MRFNGILGSADTTELFNLGPVQGINFDVHDLELSPSDSFEIIDKFIGEKDGKDWTTLGLSYDPQIISVEFEVKDQQVHITINRADREPEKVIIGSTILEVWLPSPTEVEPHSVVTLSELKQNAHFFFDITDEDIVEIEKGKNEFCTIDIIDD